MMDAKFTYALAQTSDSYYTTMGVHPTRARDPFKPVRGGENNEIQEDSRTEEEKLDEYFDRIKDFIEEN